MPRLSFIDGSDVVVAYLDLPQHLKLCGLKGRPCRNSIGILFRVAARANGMRMLMRVNAEVHRPFHSVSVAWLYGQAHPLRDLALIGPCALPASLRSGTLFFLMAARPLWLQDPD